MRLLAVTPYYEPEGGGLERYAHAILSRLARHGHEVHALSFTHKGLEDETRDGVRVQRRRPLLRLGNAPVDPGFRANVARAIRETSPDAIVAHTPVPFPAEMAYLAARGGRVPFVTTYHAGRLRASRPSLRALAALDRATFERRMLAGSAALVAVTPFVRDHALARERQRVAIVPPGVDTERFSPNGASKEPNVLFVGPLARSYRWKGVDVLWDAFQMVSRRNPDATLTLVGEGDRFVEFAQRAQSARPGIRLAGRLSEDALVEAYRRAAVVVLPSVTDAESFGMVLAEANACGRPVIGSRIGGIPDFVRDGDNGLLARPGDAADLADKILRILDDADLARALGRRGRERVVREHDWDDLAEATEVVLGNALD